MTMQTVLNTCMIKANYLTASGRTCYYSKDRVKYDSFRVFNAFVTRFSCVCMKRVLKRVDSRFSRYKRVSQQPIKSALQ